MYLILLLVVFALTGVFAVQNDGHQVFTLLGYSWTVRTWVPTAIGVGATTALLMLRMSHAGLSSRMRDMGHGREIGLHRDTIEGLRAENGRLREELAAARGEVRGQARTAAPKRTWLDDIRALPSRVGRDRSPT